MLKDDIVPSSKNVATTASPWRFYVGTIICVIVFVLVFVVFGMLF